MQKNLHKLLVFLKRLLLGETLVLYKGRVSGEMS